MGQKATIVLAQNKSINLINKMAAAQSSPIYITHRDKSRLEKMIAELKRKPMNRDDLTSLVTELGRATTVESQDIPEDVVTMNSRVAIIDKDTSEKMTFTLVFPEEADAENNKISVLAPIGSGMLGYRVGDEFEWAVPDGTRRFVIAEVVYQPEARERSLSKMPA